jgi:hypothetical protein
MEERKAWRKNKPFGFHARPETNADGWVFRLRGEERLPLLCPPKERAASLSLTRARAML